MNKVNKITVSIGIPAHNEEANIVQLLKSILSQENKYYVLKEIVIISDGSDDKTIENITSVNNKLIKLIVSKKRKGQNFRQNQIIKLFKNEVLVFIEADTLPSNNRVIDNLMEIYVKNKNKKLGAVVGWYKSITPKSFYQKIMFAGDRLKDNIYRNWKAGDNVYWKGGHSIKALSKKFVYDLKLPTDVAEDAYVYLRAKKLGYKFIRIENANMYAGSISNFSDQIKQSNKFITGINSMEKYFGKVITKYEYTIPTSNIITGLYKSLYKNFFWTSLYLISVILNRLFASSKLTLNPNYEEYRSTKKINIKQND